MAETMILESLAGVTIALQYHAGNLRIQRVNWDNATTGTIKAIIFQNGTPIYTQIEPGPGSGSENVPGIHVLVEVDEDGETFLRMPPGITYTFGVFD